MRAAGNVSAHVAIALIGAIVCAAIPLAPGVVRLVSDAFAILRTGLPSVSLDRVSARGFVLPVGTYPRADLSYGKDQSRLATTELEWAR